MPSLGEGGRPMALTAETSTEEQGLCTQWLRGSQPYPSPPHGPRVGERGPSMSRVH